MHTSNNCTIVIFGASGDLTQRKLIPALSNLFHRKLLSKKCLIVGCARKDWDDASFFAHVEESLNTISEHHEYPSFKDHLKTRLKYHRMDVTLPQSFVTLENKLSEWESQLGLTGNRLFYLAVAPEHIADIVINLGQNRMLSENHDIWRRLVIEKPFGRSIETARELNRLILNVVSENQVYRIDHYLGKETVQNILVFRFANGIFEPLWNRNFIDHIQITVSEDIGVGNRGEYYDSAGALRDMVPNHIFQLISLVAMEPPASFDANAVRNEQTKVITALKNMNSDDVLENTVRGQYDAGTVNGIFVKEYRETPGVNKHSRTETFVAMKLFIDNWRWAGIPFYFRTGKRMPVRTTEIVIQFKQVPHKLFRNTNVDQIMPNRLVLGIQPIEGIYLSISAKTPGPIVDIGRVNLRFQYSDYFGSHPDTGYERLLYDAVMGDATLFQRADMVEAGWNAVMPVLDVWRELPATDFPNYASGTWGPDSAGRLITADGRNWEICRYAC